MLRFCTFPFIILSFVASTAAFAQWNSDSSTNTPVAKVTGLQTHPQSCTDESDGVIVVWEDTRSGVGSDIYAQRIDRDGKPVWTTNGIAVCSQTSTQRYPVIASDGAGGAYVVWEDYRTSANGVDLYGQHINANGTMSYAANGVAVAAQLRDQTSASITSDGSGNAYIVWEDNRASSTNRPDIYLNKMTTGGVSFGSAGKAISTLQNQDRHPKVIADGSGGCLIAWEASLGVPISIRLQRVNASGDLQYGTGFTVFRGASYQNISRNVELRLDGAYVFLAWEVTNVSSSYGQDIFAAKVRIADTVDLWSGGAEVTSSWSGDQTVPQIFPDGSGGALVVFENFNGSLPPTFYGQDVSMVHVLSTGTELSPAFPNHIVHVTHVTLGQTNFKAVPSDNYGLIIGWNDGRLGNSDTSIYAQRMSKDLERYWPTFRTTSSWGKPISRSPNYLSKQLTMTARTNGAILVWADNRNGNYDIYAQLLFKDASLPVELVSFSGKRQDNGIRLNWKTASESKNAGFEIERRDAERDAEFAVVASYLTDARLAATSFSGIGADYEFVDQTAQKGSYDYRLSNIDLDGSRTTHPEIRVEAASEYNAGFALGAAMPNPFTKNTVINFTLADEGRVVLQFTDEKGAVITAIDAGVLSQGKHAVPLTNLPPGSRIIFCTMKVLAPNGTELWRAPTSTAISQIR